mmetsp:Transcript_10247/g.43115  ORF Transcript_10247/g.43115 Transcript_10247/m.43115 type:complete len:276 (-) Transcript_10247:349-1176(-)
MASSTARAASPIPLLSSARASCAASSAPILYGECRGPGNAPFCTSSRNCFNAASTTFPTSAYCLLNFGVTLAWCGCLVKPSRSWYTNTWPEVKFPAPMPMVGTSSAAVTAAASDPGTHSRTTAKHPASCSLSARSTTSIASSNVRPCGRNPPSTDMLWGVKPTWPITAMPASTSVLAASTRVLEPPSSFTASMPPSFNMSVAEATACFGDCSYEPNGRSPTNSGLEAPRATALQWLSISSSVMGSVVSWPCTTIAALSPTRHTSMPAWSTATALG